MERNESKYLWTIQSPLGYNIALTRKTYSDHVIEDHPNDPARRLSFPFVEGVITQPRYIYYDSGDHPKGRERYIDFVVLPDYDSLHALVVVVDTDREPYEVVTWQIKRKLNQENIIKGIIYDSRNGKMDRGGVERANENRGDSGEVQS